MSDNIAHFVVFSLSQYGRVCFVREGWFFILGLNFMDNKDLISKSSRVLSLGSWLSVPWEQPLKTQSVPGSLVLHNTNKLLSPLYTLPYQEEPAHCVLRLFHTTFTISNIPYVCFYPFYQLHHTTVIQMGHTPVDTLPSSCREISPRSLLGGWTSSRGFYLPAVCLEAGHSFYLRELVLSL